MKKRPSDLEARVGTFVRQYGRKKPRGGGEPNDRRYSRKLEGLIKRMDPQELASVIGQTEEDADEEVAPSP